MRSRRIKAGGMTEDPGSPLSKVWLSHIYLLASFRLRRKLQGKRTSFPPLPNSPRVPQAGKSSRMSDSLTQSCEWGIRGVRGTCIEVQGHSVVVLL